MLTLFRKFHRHDSGFADDRDRAFPDLLFRVLRELANPAPPAQLSLQIVHRSLAHPTAAPERKLAMTAQPLTARTNNSDANLLMFTPLDASGGRGMSRSSVACALLCNAVLVGVLGVQVHHRVFAGKPHTISLVAPVEKLPEPVRPKFTPRVIPLRTSTVQPEAPVMLRHTAEAMPAPPTPAPRYEIPVVPMGGPAAPHVIAAVTAPTVHALPVVTTPVAIQPTGPSVATVNLSRSGLMNTTGVPGVVTANLSGTRGATVGATVSPAGPVHLGGCTACPTGDSNRSAIPKPVQPRPVPSNPHVEKTPAPAVAQAPSLRSAPIVLFKPKANYTPEATAMAIEGTVRVSIRVSADGAVTVLGVSSGLGHGLDESATQCAQGIKFKPALDGSGRPMDWEGVVSITFQIS